MIYPPHHTFRPKTVQALGFCGWLGSGVKDKNGTEIYEGDLVRVDGERYTIEFRDGCFFVGNAYLLIQFSTDPDEIEVVGHVAEENCT